ncbi:multiple inositol polyphosphate phosphatase 1 isoform X1 [Prunus yedoensis var. nudiflora]|uniref:Multiple inositol polyphosphate phosphatase 1 n=1 Tax=Prunus yedoensis var. nudiflora TaxID=2094558 RepID=A0A314XRJ1_PRUYE|nr:multiple inositol polyphosphate phosphatase 1 isoform X1 [Prunus yedoensis var. nudiflora]
MKLAMVTVLLVLLSLLIHSNAEEEAFDVRQHLSTVTRQGMELVLLPRNGLKSWTTWQLIWRTRARFPNLFNDDYHPDVYAIKATQVPRASASAVAFGMGLFSGKGSLGPGHHRAFAVTGESHASDTMLRFHDCCQNYKAFKKSQEPAVDKLKEPVYDAITSAVRRCYRLNFTRQDTTSLWFLCKQEASLLNIVDQACALFRPSEVSLLEWTDDLEAFILKGYGKSINYRMGVPLLEDVVQSMEQAIKAEVEFQKIRRERSLQLPPKPPQKRNWKGNTVAPFGGNNMLVLYSCPASTSNKHFVQVLRNEHPIPMPGCDGTDFCPLDVFKERIVAPHLKHDYNSVCNVKLEQQEQKPVASKLSQLFRWMFSLGNGDKRSLDEL